MFARTFQIFNGTNLTPALVFYMISFLLRVQPIASTRTIWHEAHAFASQQEGVLIYVSSLLYSTYLHVLSGAALHYLYCSVQRLSARALRAGAFPLLVVHPFPARASSRTRAVTNKLLSTLYRSGSSTSVVRSTFSFVERCALHRQRDELLKGVHLFPAREK